MATEATQFDGGAGQRSGAEVKAELAVACAQGQLAERGESYGGIRTELAGAPSTLSRSGARSQTLAQRTLR